MWISFSKSIPEPPHIIHIGNKEIERVNAFKLLGIWCQNNLKWNTQMKLLERQTKDYIISGNVGNHSFQLMWVL